MIRKIGRGIGTFLLAVAWLALSLLGLAAFAALL